MSIIDTPFNTESKIPCLLSQGVQTVIRYYNFSNSRTLAAKRLELAEAQALAAQGIQIAAIFQQRHDRVEDFTALKGLTAGRRAIAMRRIISANQPAQESISRSILTQAAANSRTISRPTLRA